MTEPITARAPVAVINCDVHLPDKVLHQGLVLVEGGVIRAVGSSHEIPLPTNVRLIDARGGFVTPGLIDVARPSFATEAPEVQGVTAYLLAVAVAAVEDLPALAQAAVAVANPPHRSRSLGLHLMALWPLDGPVGWEDVWALAAGAIRLVTVGNEDPATARQALAAGAAIAVPVDARHPFLRDLLVSGRAIGWHSGSIVPLSTLSPSPAPLHLVSVAAALPLLNMSTELVLMSGDGQMLATTMLAELVQSSGAGWNHIVRWATWLPADLLRLPRGRLVAGSPADLLCWTRYGELAWTMRNGVIVHPSAIPADAGAWLAALLRRHPQTLAVEDVRDDPERGAAGIDLIWRFRRPDGREETTTLVMHQDGALADDNGYRFEFDLTGATSTSIVRTGAHWCFYLFTAPPALYALPVRGLQNWLLAHPQRFGAANASVPVRELLATLPRAHQADLDLA